MKHSCKQENAKARISLAASAGISAFLNLAMFGVILWQYNNAFSFIIPVAGIDVFSDGSMLAWVCLFAITTIGAGKLIENHKSTHKMQKAIRWITFATAVFGLLVVVYESFERYDDVYATGMNITVLGVVNLLINIITYKLLLPYKKVHAVHTLVVCNQVDIIVSFVMILTGLLMPLSTLIDPVFATIAALLSFVHLVQHMRGYHTHMIFVFKVIPYWITFHKGDCHHH